MPASHARKEHRRMRPETAGPAQNCGKRKQLRHVQTASAFLGHAGDGSPELEQGIHGFRRFVFCWTTLFLKPHL